MNALVQAYRYNVMQSKVDTVLGTGSGYYGYGQEVRSQSVSNEAVIDDIHMNQLRLDIQDAWVHQQNVVPTINQAVEGEDITEDLWEEYEALCDQVFQNANNIGGDQFDLEVVNGAERRQPWGGENQPQQIEHNFDIVFESLVQRRAFFNTGGELRFRPTSSGGSGAKDNDWAALIAATGTVTWSNNGVFAAGGTSTTILHLDLTEEYQRLHVKQGSGLYVNNEFSVWARATAPNIITISLRFYDGEEVDLDGDESVTLAITTTISQIRAIGSFVEVPSPVYVNNVELN